jgi:hypothetical protein
MRLIKKLIWIAAVAGALICVGQVQADPGAFPNDGPTDDSFDSLGTFRIFVAPAFQSRITGCFIYNPTTFRLQSPTMYDPATVVGYSYPHTHGSALDTGGTQVGSAHTIIADSSFTLVPPGFQGPAGEREVHTEVRSLNLVDLWGFGAHVRAGTQAPSRPISPGEVESKATGMHIGDPAFDFPAESFFDVFVEVYMPAGCGNLPAMTLYNSQPLLIANDTLTDPPGFPPRVVYVHENTNAVPVYFKNDIAGWGKAGDLFGWLVLAGHGASYTNSAEDIDEFETFMDTVPEMPVGPVGGIAERPPLAGASAEEAGAPTQGSGSSAGTYAALAGGVAAAAVVLSAGAWYVRRRWIR